MKIKTYCLIFLCYTVFLLLSCASLSAPSGGPDDKEGPNVLSAYPAPKSLNIATNVKFLFSFSEWISTRSERSITVFPTIRFKTKIYRDKLEIIPLQKLEDSTTYHIAINSSLQDLHGNSISTPYNLIFSTGPILDSGSIEGCIIDPVRPKLQPKIALFSQSNKADSGITGPPSYLLQADSMGRFSFSHLRKDTFSIIAYLDVNNDSRLQNKTEQVYIPNDSLIVIQSLSSPIQLYPAQFDTSFPYLTTIKTNCDKLLSGTWNREYDSHTFKQPTFTIENTTPPEQVKNFTYHQSSGPSSLAITFSTPLKRSQYRLIYSITRIFDNKNETDTLLFNGTNKADTVKPVFVSSSPNQKAHLNTDIKIVWSEPVFLKDTLLFSDTSGDTVRTICRNQFTDTSTLIPLKKFREGKEYRLALMIFDGKDFSGNHLKSKDTTDTAAIITIHIIENDSIAISMQGNAECLKTVKNVTWIFWPFNQPDYFTTRSTEKGFCFDSIPARKGRIGFFIDNNFNHRPDVGRVLPWIAPEPFYINPDTIEARARWDIEGLEIPVCDLCQKIDNDTTSDSTNANKPESR